MMNIQEKAGLQWECSPDIPVPHGFTTRCGGVSQGIYRGLNLGLSRGDSREAVLENYRLLGKAMGFSPENAVQSKQVHGDRVRLVRDADRGAGLFAPALEPCDGLITALPGTALVVFTADCTPILLCDRATGAVGAVHAGWRGTALDIAGKAVRAMEAAFGTRPEDISAAVGPNIGKCHFETNHDVPDEMFRAFGSEMENFITKTGTKYHVDLKGINRWLLRRAGVQTIAVSDSCTMCDPDRFWSHRVTQGQRGAQAGIIVCGRTAV